MSDQTSANEETTTHESQSHESTTADHNPWDDVLRDFRSLGESITKAVQEAIKDERNRESLHEVRTNVEDMADKFSQSMNETRSEMKTEMKKAVGDVREIGSKVYKDSKPVIVTALQTLNDGLQNIIEHLQEDNVVVESTPESGETAATDTPKEV